MKNQLWVMLIILAFGCQSTQEEKDPAGTLVGNWKAQWTTSVESIPEAKDSHLTMNASYTFTEDSVWIELYGYEGCLFYQDTLSNTIPWKLSGDVLSLIGEDNSPSLTFDVKSLSSEKVELVLLNDIFITLTP